MQDSTAAVSFQIDLTGEPGRRVILHVPNRGVLLAYQAHVCSVGYDPCWLTDLARRMRGTGSLPLRIYSGDEVCIHAFFDEEHPPLSGYRQGPGLDGAVTTRVLGLPPAVYHDEGSHVDYGTIARGNIDQLRRRRWRYWLTDPSAFLQVTLCLAATYWTVHALVSDIGVRRLPAEDFPVEESMPDFAKD